MYIGNALNPMCIQFASIAPALVRAIAWSTYGLVGRFDEIYLNEFRICNCLRRMVTIALDSSCRLRSGETLADLLPGLSDSKLPLLQDVETAERIALNSQVREHHTQCIILSGPGGIGKSTFVEEFCLQKNLKPYYLSPGWNWDGYRGNEIVIIDDMYPNMITSTQFKRLVDSTPFRVPTSKGSIEFTSTLILITSNWHVVDNDRQT